MMAQILNLIHHYGQLFFGPMWPVVWILVRIAVIVLPLLGMAAFLTLWERKVIGWMHGWGRTVWGRSDCFSRLQTFSRYF